MHCRNQPLAQYLAMYVSYEPFLGAVEIDRRLRPHRLEPTVKRFGSRFRAVNLIRSGSSAAPGAEPHRIGRL